LQQIKVFIMPFCIDIKLKARYNDSVIIFILMSKSVSAFFGKKEGQPLKIKVKFKEEKKK